MNKTIILPSSKATALQRWLSAAAVGVSTLLLVVWLCGVIPFNGRSTGALAMWECLLELMYMGRKSFISVAARVGFGVLYCFLAVKSVVAHLGAIKNVKKWFFAKEDGEETKNETKKCVQLFNATAWKFLILLIVSFFCFNYRLAGASLAVVILLFIFALAFNSAYFFYVTQKPFDSIIATASRLLLVAGAVLFCFKIADVEAQSALKSFVDFFFLINLKNVPGSVCLDAFMQSIVVPVTYIWIAVSLLNLCRAAFADDANLVPKAKSKMIKSIVITLIIVLVSGFVNKYKDGEVYLSLLFDNIAMIGIPALAFVASGAANLDLPEAATEPSSDGTESTDAQSDDVPEKEVVDDIAAMEAETPNIENQ